jgi:hypothetical protein
MLKKILSYTLLIFPSVLFARNSFLVAPTSAEISMKKPTTMSFVVTNNGDEVIRIAIAPIYFEVGSKFMPPSAPLVPKTTKDDNITPFMVISPKVLSIRPGDQRTVRVSIRPGSDLAPGEYRGHVLFSMLDIANTIGKKAKKGEGMSMVLNFKSETAVVIYGSVGSGVADLKTTCSLAKNGNLKVKITNSGKWRFDGWMRIYDPKSNKKLVEDKVFMTRESMKDSTLNWKPKDATKPLDISWVPLDEKKKTIKTKCKLS